MKIIARTVTGEQYELLPEETWESVSSSLPHRAFFEAQSLPLRIKTILPVRHIVAFEAGE